MKKLGLLLFCSLFGSAAWAQTPPKPVLEDAPITKLPKIVNFVEAVYPSAALRDRIGGKVVLELDISAAGRVEKVGVVTSATVAETLSATVAKTLGVVRSATIADYGFVRAATTAVSQFDFSPAEAGGVPVPVRIGYTYNFSLPPIVVAATTTTSTTPATGPPKRGIVNLAGVMRERGTRSLLTGVIVTVFRGEGEEASGFETITDDEGRFEFFDLEPGTWRILAEAPGFYPLRTAEEVVGGQITEVTYYLERGTYNPYEVVVEATRVKKEVNRRTLTRAEIVKVPGTLGDPVLVIENLPGVARQLGGGQLIVRGSGPNDTGVFINGISVPLIYHFGGLKSVIPADVVESIDFYPGNFSVKYGRATGGVFDAQSRKLEPDQIHGALDVSILDTSAYLEIPLGEDASIAVAGRRSYIDFILAAVVPDDSGIGLISAPRYYDYQVIGNWRPSPKHELKLFGLGSDDIFEILFENPSENNAQLQSNNLQFGTNFQRLILEHVYTPNDKMANNITAAIGRDRINFSLGEQFRFDLTAYQFQVRQAFDWKLEDWMTITFGLDYLGTLADVEVLLPPPPRPGDSIGDNDASDVVFTRVEGQWNNNIAPYVEAVMKFGDLTLVPGVRLDYFESIDQFSVDPRIIGRYALTSEVVVKAGAGVVHQDPEPQDVDEQFGNPALGVIRGFQYSVGAEWRPEDYLKFDATLFYKDLTRLPASAPPPLNVDNIGTGRVYGFELFLEHKFNNNFRGWLSYTLSRSDRRDAPDKDRYVYDFDQTHILALVFSYVLPENWEFGVRWRLVSGNPNTPFGGGTLASDLDQYLPRQGALNSERLPLFHQLDLRIDKTWVWDVWRLSAYLSLLNSYNKTNTEGFVYQYDFLQRVPLGGLPILPILGMKGEF